MLIIAFFFSSFPFFYFFTCTPFRIELQYSANFLFYFGELRKNVYFQNLFLGYAERHKQNPTVSKGVWRQTEIRRKIKKERRFMLEGCWGKKISVWKWIFSLLFFPNILSEDVKNAFIQAHIFCALLLSRRQWYGCCWIALCYWEKRELRIARQRVKKLCITESSAEIFFEAFSVSSCLKSWHVELCEKKKLKNFLRVHNSTNSIDLYAFHSPHKKGMAVFG